MNNTVKLLAVLLVCVWEPLGAVEDSRITTTPYNSALKSITEVLLTDASRPPVAARVYAYACLAAYLPVKDQQGLFSVSCLVETSPFLASKLIGSTSFGEELTCPEFVGVYAMLLVASKLTASGYMLEPHINKLKDQFLEKKLILPSNVDVHVSAAEVIARKVVAVSKSDGYAQISAKPRYTPKNNPGTWQPTPPGYLRPVEPHWGSMRTFFVPDPTALTNNDMAIFDMREGAEFRRLVMEVFTTSQHLTEEQKLAARFWDDNPQTVDFVGHTLVGVKRISPGAHWLSIAGDLAEQKGLGYADTASLLSLLSLTLHDTFVCCWYTKYETDRVRPETIIKQFVDRDWSPFIQTPPFPEYTSGHAAVSTAAARVLTRYFGPNQSFEDRSQVRFGLPVRTFSSFDIAADEAAVSRLYGGIHFRDAILHGQKQGADIADLILGLVKNN